MFMVEVEEVGLVDPQKSRAYRAISSGGGTSNADWITKPYVGGNGYGKQVPSTSNSVNHFQPRNIIILWRPTLQKKEDSGPVLLEVELSECSLLVDLEAVALSDPQNKTKTRRIWRDLSLFNKRWWRYLEHWLESEDLRWRQQLWRPDPLLIYHRALGHIPPHPRT
ncbi:hypothetical protein ARMGADRAFT_1127426 [Armillaria gallica]|uniref:Uncharacterized protein n=1 Tax=Armillaria gallica TaxID=47427 RepID=A0A2H3D756_ARMGA|nr:hypothetical protein ARMGADRAFT_1127426 [Armillaria gallica]